MSLPTTYKCAEKYSAAVDQVKVRNFTSEKPLGVSVWYSLFRFNAFKYGLDYGKKIDMYLRVLFDFVYHVK